MWRHSIKPRPGWRDKVVEQGLVFPMTDMPDGSERPYWNESAWYEVTLEEVLHLERVTEELYEMCKHAASVMASGDRFSDVQLGLPPGTLPLVQESLKRDDLSVYARFDLAWNGVEPKMLEINGDTPTGLVESAVIQWNWLEDVFPDADQWNSVHDRLVKWWSEQIAMRPPAGQRGALLQLGRRDHRRRGDDGGLPAGHGRDGRTGDVRA